MNFTQLVVEVEFITFLVYDMCVCVMDDYRQTKARGAKMIQYEGAADTRLHFRSGKT
jgi:hypothetical protein